MDSFNSDILSLLNPNDIIPNMPFDESFDFRNSDYISSEDEDNEEPNWLGLEDCKREASYTDDSETVSQNKMVNNFPLPPSPPNSNFKNIINKIGDGKMEYIIKPIDKKMMTTAWQAITETNNWYFVAQDIESFMFSSDPKINEIYRKIQELGYHGHSGCSFGSTMRNMQFLVKNGEEKFKKLFEKPKKD